MDFLSTGGVASRPQNLQTLASFLIISAQCGHFFEVPFATSAASMRALSDPIIRTNISPITGDSKNEIQNAVLEERPLLSAKFETNEQKTNQTTIAITN